MTRIWDEQGIITNKQNSRSCLIFSPVCLCHVPVEVSNGSHLSSVRVTLGVWGGGQRRPGMDKGWAGILDRDEHTCKYLHSWLLLAPSGTFWINIFPLFPGRKKSYKVFKILFSKCLKSFSSHQSIALSDPAPWSPLILSIILDVHFGPSPMEEPQAQWFIAQKSQWGTEPKGILHGCMSESLLGMRIFLDFMWWLSYP